MYETKLVLKPALYRRIGDDFTFVRDANLTRACAALRNPQQMDTILAVNQCASTKCKQCDRSALNVFGRCSSHLQKDLKLKIEQRAQSVAHSASTRSVIAYDPDVPFNSGTPVFVAGQRIVHMGNVHAGQLQSVLTFDVCEVLGSREGAGHALGAATLKRFVQYMRLAYGLNVFRILYNIPGTEEDVDAINEINEHTQRMCNAEMHLEGNDAIHIDALRDINNMQEIVVFVSEEDMLGMLLYPRVFSEQQASTLRGDGGGSQRSEDELYFMIEEARVRDTTVTIGTCNANDGNIAYNMNVDAQ